MKSIPINTSQYGSIIDWYCSSLIGIDLYWDTFWINARNLIRHWSLIQHVLLYTHTLRNIISQKACYAGRDLQVEQWNWHCPRWALLKSFSSPGYLVVLYDPWWKVLKSEGTNFRFFIAGEGGGKLYTASVARIGITPTLRIKLFGNFATDVHR